MARGKHGQSAGLSPQEEREREALREKCELITYCTGDTGTIWHERLAALEARAVEPADVPEPGADDEQEDLNDGTSA